MHTTHHDMSLSCMLLLTANNLMGWMSTFGFIEWLQIIGLIMGMIASGYVAYNQHLTAKWKKGLNQKEQNPKETKQDEQQTG